VVLMMLYRVSYFDVVHASLTPAARQGPWTSLAELYPNHVYVCL